MKQDRENGTSETGNSSNDDDSDENFEGEIGLEDVYDLPTLLKKYDQGGFPDEDAIWHACKLGVIHHVVKRMNDDELKIHFEEMVALIGRASMPDSIDLVYFDAKYYGDPSLQDPNVVPESETSQPAAPEKFNNIPALWEEYKNAAGSSHRKGVIQRACELGNWDRGDRCID